MAQIAALPDAASLSGVGSYTQSQTGQLCIPSSIVNSLTYYRNTRGKTNLWSSSTSISTVASEVARYMRNTSANAYIPDAVIGYAESKGYTAFCDNIWSPAYFDFQWEIYYGDCPLIGFASATYGGGHMTTGVGYAITSSGTQTITVYDNHVTYTRTYTFSSDENDFVAALFFN